MATYTQYTETITRAIWSVPAPATFTEVSKAIYSAEYFLNEAGAFHPLSDDSIMVEVTDDAILVVVTVKS